MNSYKLKDLLSIKNGKDHKELNDGNIPVFGSGGIMRYGDKALFEDESILLPRKGTLSNIQYVNEPFWTVDTIYYSVVNKKLANPFYLFNYLKSLDLSNLNSGTGVPSMTFNSYYDLHIKLPDLSTQKAIAKVLSDLDAKIELNNRINRELEAMAKMVYDYWFVQFDFPNEQGKPYKSSGGKMVYNAELKREIPEGWEVGNLKNNSLTDLIKPKIDFFEGKKTYLATADVVNNEINFDADKITFENRESRANMQPIKNSVWFAKMKNSKKVLCVGEYSNYYLLNFILSTGFAGLKCKEKHFVEYIWGFVNNDDFEKIKDRLSNGATQEAINNDSMAYIPLIVPKGNILKKYHKMTIKIFKKIYLNKIENQQLTELRDWLLPMLMNGQVVSTGSTTVKEAEESLSSSAERSRSMAAEPSVEYKKG
ncbi:MAG: restriction endonuclease subunit S [Victivallaceae bacterium]|nr:restriction endonuclease subunit S [Victivallaceae bacterium]MDD3702655.1 restriction endonuclease subunit S [Victivallaceae bacterium]